MSDTTWWYLMRAAGLTAWVFLTLTLVWGAVVAGRLAPKGAPRRWLNDLHPYLGGVGLGALVLHVVAAVADSMARVGVAGALVPFASSWRPGAVALGVVAMWLLVVVQATSLARRRLSKVAWHRIHLSSYVAAWAVTLHAVYAGTDLRSPVVAWGALALVGVSTLVASARALRADDQPRRDRVPVGARRPPSPAAVGQAPRERRRTPVAV